jgi:hypothetical protein
LADECGRDVIVQFSGEIDTLTDGIGFSTLWGGQEFQVLVNGVWEPCNYGVSVAASDRLYFTGTGYGGWPLVDVGMAWRIVTPPEGFPADLHGTL